MTLLDAVHSAIEYGRYNEAMRLLHTAIAAEPAAPLLLERGRVYVLLGNTEAALADLQAASAADPQGASGDAARTELLRLLTPPPVLQPAQPAPTRERPYRWAVYVLLFVLILSFICTLIFILNTGQAIVGPYLTPMPAPTP